MPILAAVGARGDVVYVWCGDGTIQRIGTNGVPAVFAASGLSGASGPVGLALDNAGNLYAGVPGVSVIWKYSPAGAQSVIGEIDSVGALAFDGAGGLYASLPNFITVVKPDYTLGEAYFVTGQTTNYTSANLIYPISLAFDGAGNLYAVNNTNANPMAVSGSPNPYDDTIARYGTNFTGAGTFAAGLDEPWGLAFDSGGNLFVANSGTDSGLSNSIVRFSPAGSPSTFATGTNGLNSPRGLAFDSAGNLYVANSGNGTIEKFDTNGNGTFFATGLSTPTSIAIFPGRNVFAATGIRLNNPTVSAGGTHQFGLQDNPGLAFAVLGATNLSLATSNWTTIGSVTEVAPGDYQFTDPQTTNGARYFYKVRSE